MIKGLLSGSILLISIISYILIDNKISAIGTTIENSSVPETIKKNIDMKISKITNFTTMIGIIIILLIVASVFI